MFISVLYAYGIVLSAIWVYLSTSVADLGRAFRRGQDATRVLRSAHLARKTIPYMHFLARSELLCA